MSLEMESRKKNLKMNFLKMALQKQMLMKRNGKRGMVIFLPIRLG